MSSKDHQVTRTGIIFVASGPSGTGKSTICKEILKKNSNLYFSISCTTRSPRTGEENGRDYYFISDEEFQDRVGNGEFIEFAVVHGNHYGTLYSEVDRFVDSGEDVLLDIDVQGVTEVQRGMKADSSHRNSRFIFVGPPSIEELERRLRSRATESEDRIRKRLDVAYDELRSWRNYDFLVINSELQKAVADITAIIQSERHRCDIINNNPWKEID